MFGSFLAINLCSLGRAVYRMHLREKDAFDQNPGEEINSHQFKMPFSFVFSTSSPERCFGDSDENKAKNKCAKRRFNNIIFSAANHTTPFLTD
jgi:hypothetical protein